MQGGVGMLVAARYLLSAAVGQGGMGRVWRGAGTSVWSTTTKSVVATMTDPHSQGVIAVAFGPDGLLAAVDAYHATYLWRITSGRSAS